MGIPKFFRYISERYPLTSQLIQENKIPEFDNLYVDFNGIIHNCSHPNDDDAHFRLSEEQIFTSIFTYVEHLFSKIKPKKLFFMAVDGVAPRAKMNQQRSRRFRTAKEAKELREKAESKGEKLPEEKAFDSNCITPGTPFMARLSQQLRYFVNKKISEDADWAGVEVVLSGHEVPGEGEHKIMEYIRLSKAQPGYDPNVRHCLYGLDADLIMLGLLSHDPHFCLLREEVKFGPAAKKRNTNLQSTNFFLLHLCLLREYLDLEFGSIAPTLPFEYSLERIIDDFVLLAVFIGNDFLPHLPDLHIHENGLERLFDIYKRVLPAAGGYINNSGTINPQRLQLVLNEMAHWEEESMHKDVGDANWLKSKKRSYNDEVEAARRKGALVMTKGQQKIFNAVRTGVLARRRGKKSGKKPVAFPNDFNARDRAFISSLAADLNLSLAWDGFDEDGHNVVSFEFPTDDDHVEELTNGEHESDWEDDDEEANVAVDRVLNKYGRAKILDDDAAGFEAREAQRQKEKLEDWKWNYYQEKLGFKRGDTKAVETLVYRWVEGLQWVMYYYYSGVASWAWFYDYHYAPRISDMSGVDKMSFNFELGTPFRPYQQLMGVLPEASKEHIPLAYRDLMYDPNSPILDFYPKSFEQDMNGKKAEWEAIVKIPFLDQNRLLKAMAARDHRLTPEEVQRNSFGNSTRFTYSPEEHVYPSSLPGFFPDLHHCTCREEPFFLPTLDGLHLVPGLCEGVFLGSAALAGFPSLKTIPYTGHLEHHKVNVFQSDSRNQSMVIEVDNRFEGMKPADIATQMVGKKTYIGWPFLQEGMVVGVSDGHFRYENRAFGNAQRRVLADPLSGMALSNWRRSATKIEEHYSRRYAVQTGSVDVLLHVRPLKGLKRTDDGALVKDYEGQDKEVEQALQLSLQEVISEDTRYLEKGAPPLSEEFPSGTKVIFLGELAYGHAAQVSDSSGATLSVILAFFPSEKAENEKFANIVQTRQPARYYSSYDVGGMLGISGFALSKITSSFMVLTSDGSKTNLGLSLKFEAKGLKVMDYSRKNGKYWEYSDKAIKLIQDYKTLFPELFLSLDNRQDDMLRASDIFRVGNPDARVKDAKTWLGTKGVRGFEPVSLNTDSLPKDTITEIEQLADTINATKSAASIKKAIVQAIPRQAVLKPSHAVHRLQNQAFALGDRVTMVQDSGSVPICAKGVVVGLNQATIDVVWDVAFMSGTTLDGRCSQYRGSTMTYNSCLNLTNRQYAVSTRPKAQQQPQTSPNVPVHVTNGVAGSGGGRGGAAARGGRARGGISHVLQPKGVPHIMVNPARTAQSAPRAPGPAPIAPGVTAGTAPAFNARLAHPPGQGVNAPAAPAPALSHTEQMMSQLNIQSSDGGPGPARGRGRGSAGGSVIVPPHVYAGMHGGNVNGFSRGRGRGRGGYRGAPPRGRGGAAAAASSPATPPS